MLIFCVGTTLGTSRQKVYVDALFFAGATIMMACVGLALKVSTRIVTSNELVILALAMHFTPFPPIC